MRQWAVMRGPGGPDTPVATGDGRRATPAIAALSISLLASMALVGWIFLDRYREPARSAPAGSDTSHHEWRTEVVAHGGLEALPAFAGRAQALNTNADRPGLPVAGAIASAANVAEPTELSYLLPAVMAVIIGITAAAFARGAMGAATWSLPAFVAGVGACVPVALSANGYFDQMTVMPLLLGAGTCVVAAATDRRIHLAATLLLGGAFAVHWQFAALFTLLLLFVSLGSLARSVRERRLGTLWWRLPAITSLVTTAGGLTVGAAALLGTPGSLRTPLGLTREGIIGNLTRQTPWYRFPVPAVAAAAGAATTFAFARPRSRRSLWLLVPWALVPAAAAVAFVAGIDLPVQRALMFALAIPILGIALLEGLVRIARRAGDSRGSSLGWMAAAAAASLSIAAVAWSVGTAREAWSARPVATSDGQRSQLQATARYIASSGRPAIVVVDVAETGGGAPGADFGSVPLTRRLRAELDPPSILDVTPYLGDPAELLEGRPTLRPGITGFDETSLELWASVQPLLGRDPLILVLRAFDDRFDTLVREQPQWQATEWLAVVRGPRPQEEVVALSAPSGPAFGTLAAKAALVVLAVSLVGSGWAWATGPSDRLTRCLLAPATGISVVVVAGIASEHLGLRAGRWGAAIAVIAAFGGWAVAAGRAFGGRRGRTGPLSGRDTQPPTGTERPPSRAD